jgi:hypothetical protein
MATSELFPKCSSDFTASATSSALAFSARLACRPFHCVTVRPVSSRNTSPELSEATETGTCITRTLRLPLTCNKRVVYASRSTAVNAESTPPARYCAPVGQSCKNSSLSHPCVSRNCVGRSPRSWSSSTVSSAAAPASSRVLSAPIQKCTFISVEPLLSHVWSTM